MRRHQRDIRVVGPTYAKQTSEAAFKRHEGALRRIHRSNGEQAAWRTFFEMAHRPPAGITQEMHRALMIGASWKVACAHLRKARKRHASDKGICVAQMMTAHLKADGYFLPPMLNEEITLSALHFLSRTSGRRGAPRA